MSSYGFSIRIAASDLQQLIKGGYVFAASKSVGASAGGQNVQWITSPLLAPNLTVSWTENYSLYFTNTAIVNGAQISQDNTAPVVTGRAYKYENATFQEDPTHAPVSAGSIAITNNEPVAANYGLSQAASVGSNIEAEPLIIVSLYQNGGSCTFTPSETVTIGFSKTYINPGVVAEVQTSLNTFTLTAGKQPTFSFADGVWSQSLSRRTPQPGSLFFKWGITLSYPVSPFSLKQYLQAKAGNSIVVRDVKQDNGSSYVVTLNGMLDPTRILTTLNGKRVRSVFIQRRNDCTVTKTIEVRITEVQLAELTLEEQIWNNFKFPASILGTSDTNLLETC